MLPTGLVSLVSRSKASGADVDPLDRAALFHHEWLNVGQPAALGPMLGMTHIMAKDWPFSANVTANCH